MYWKRHKLKNTTRGGSGEYLRFDLIKIVGKIALVESLRGGGGGLWAKLPLHN